MDTDIDRRVAVVVITHNRRTELLGTIGHLAALPEQPPIIVVDNASADGTIEAVAHEFPRVQLIKANRNLGAASRNLGVQATEAAYVAFCDDDTWWEPGDLRRAADLLDSVGHLALVMARVLVGPEEREDPICQEILRSPMPRPLGVPGVPLVGFLAGASMIRRTAFLEVGGFRSEAGIGGEEDWLAADLMTKGWGLCYVPHLCVHHYPSPHRDPVGRRKQVICNALTFAWLRRPFPSALSKTFRLCMTSRWEKGTASGFTFAAVQIGRLWRQRRVVPREIEGNYRLLETWRSRRPPVAEAEEAFRAVRSRP